MHRWGSNYNSSIIGITAGAWISIFGILYMVGQRNKSLLYVSFRAIRSFLNLNPTISSAYIFRSITYCLLNFKFPDSSRFLIQVGAALCFFMNLAVLQSN